MSTQPGTVVSAPERPVSEFRATLHFTIEPNWEHMSQIICAVNMMSGTVQSIYPSGTEQLPDGSWDLSFVGRQSTSLERKPRDTAKDGDDEKKGGSGEIPVEQPSEQELLNERLKTYLEETFAQPVVVTSLHPGLANLADVELCSILNDWQRNSYGGRISAEELRLGRRHTDADDFLTTGTDTAYFTLDMLFDKEPDLDTLATCLSYANAVWGNGFLIGPYDASREDDGSLWINFVGSIRPRSGDYRFRRAEAAATAWIAKTEERVSDFFKCACQLSPLEVSPDKPENMKLIQKRPKRGFFGPEPITKEDLEHLLDANSTQGQAKFDSLVGMGEVRRQLEEIAAYAAGCPTDQRPCLHMAFRGNPGTGKTTMARVFADLLRERGVIKKDAPFVEADRESLVGQYVGQTAVKTKCVVEEARGGVLFIDEAYALGMYEGGHDFGEEALATLIKAMEDSRDELVIIMAGYTKPMDQMISKNPGLRDRIGFYLDFPDYTAPELTQILEGMAAKEGYALDEGARGVLTDSFGRILAAHMPDFANGRVARKVYERMRMRQATLHETSKDMSADVVSSVFTDPDIRAMTGKKSGSRITVGFAA